MDKQQTALELVHDIVELMHISGDTPIFRECVAAIIKAHVQQRCKGLVEALENSLALNENWVATAEPDELLHLSEYKATIENAQTALATFNQPNQDGGK